MARTLRTGRHFKHYIALGIIALLAAGCASIVSGGPQAIPINSTPSGAGLQVMDMKTGNVIHEASTPFTVTLPRGAGYFKKAIYKVTVVKEGYEPKEVMIEGRANGWYIAGNLIFGGLIGWLIVDPATGAMWTLQPKDVQTELAEKTVRFQQKEGLTIMLATELPDAQRNILQNTRPVKAGQ